MFRSLREQLSIAIPNSSTSFNPVTHSYAPSAQRPVLSMQIIPQEPSELELQHESSDESFKSAEAFLTSSLSVPRRSRSKSVLARQKTLPTPQLSIYESNTVLLYESTPPTQGERSNEQSYREMPLTSRSKKKQSAGAFQPVDTISEASTDSQTTKSNLQRTRPFHRTPSASADPPPKRQRLHSTDILSDQSSRAASCDHDEVAYPTSINITHISSLPSKRTSRARDFDTGVRSLDKRMKPADRHKGQPPGKVKKVHVERYGDTEPNDFEMSGMDNGIRQSAALNSSRISGASLVVRSDRRATEKGHLNEADDEEVSERKTDAGREVEGIPKPKPNMRNDHCPDSTRQLSGDDQTSIELNDRCQAKDREKSLAASADMSENLRDKFRRDEPRAPEDYAQEDTGIDDTDELQRSPDDNKTTAKSDAGATTNSTTSKSGTTKPKRSVGKNGDAFEDDERALGISIHSLSGTRSVKERRLLKEAEKERNGKCLTSCYFDSVLYDEPSILLFESPNFFIKFRNGKKIHIEPTNFKEVRCHSSGEDGKHIQLLKAKSHRIDAVNYMVFELSGQIDDFREKFVCFAKCKHTPKTEQWVEEAYRRLKQRLLDAVMPNTLLEFGNVSGPRQTRNQTNKTHDKASVKRARPPTPYYDALKNGDISWKEPLKYKPGASNQVAHVDPEDLDKLKPDEFLNDNLIWFGLRYMLENSANKERVHCFNSYFYSYLTKNCKNKQISYDDVKKWTSKQKVDIFEKDFVIVPINETYHWYLAIICNLPAALPLPENAGVAVNLVDGASSEACAKLSKEIDATNQNDVLTKAVDYQQKDMEDKYSQLSLESDNVQDGTDTADKSTLSASNVQRNVATKEVTLAGPKHGGLNQRGTSLSPKSEEIATATAVEPDRSKRPLIFTLDSLGNAGHNNVLRNLKEYVQAEAWEKKGVKIQQPIGIKTAGIPEQQNSCDCGLFLIEYVKRFLFDPDTFVEKLSNHQMTKDYWPDFQAEDVRDNFRETLLREVSATFGGGPSTKTTLPSATVDSTVEEFNGELDVSDGSAAPKQPGAPQERATILRSNHFEQTSHGKESRNRQTAVDNSVEVPISRPSDIPEQTNSEEFSRHGEALTIEAMTKTNSSNESTLRHTSTLSARNKDGRDLGNEERPPTRGKGH